VADIMTEKIISPGMLLAGTGLMVRSINWHIQFRVFSLEKLFLENEKSAVT
jgi:trimethylamine:corrinoid methyltransferase-like protein